MKKLCTTRLGSFGRPRFAGLSCLLIVLAAAPVAGWSQSAELHRDNKPAALQVGELAPAFAAKAVEGDAVFETKVHRDQKPVILFFGSWS